MMGGDGVSGGRGFGFWRLGYEPGTCKGNRGAVFGSFSLVQVILRQVTYNPRNNSI